MSVQEPIDSLVDKRERAREHAVFCSILSRSFFFLVFSLMKEKLILREINDFDFRHPFILRFQI